MGLDVNVNRLLDATGQDVSATVVIQLSGAALIRLCLSTRQIALE